MIELHDPWREDLPTVVARLLPYISQHLQGCALPARDAFDLRGSIASVVVDVFWTLISFVAHASNTVNSRSIGVNGTASDAASCLVTRTKVPVVLHPAASSIG